MMPAGWQLSLRFMGADMSWFGKRGEETNVMDGDTWLAEKLSRSDMYLIQ